MFESVLGFGVWEFFRLDSWVSVFCYVLSWWVRIWGELYFLGGNGVCYVFFVFFLVSSLIWCGYYSNGSQWWGESVGEYCGGGEGDGGG